MNFLKSPDSNLNKSDLDKKDPRLAYLLVLLRQLDQFTHELEGLSEPELSEIISAAIRVCGFVEPVEAQHVIAAVLEALETRGPLRTTSPYAINGIQPS